MARVKRGVAAHKKHKKVLKEAEGRRGAKHKLVRPAKEAALHALTYALRDRRARKAQFRSLWIARINAACRQHNLSYSKFIAGLKKAGITLNRKMLSEMVIRDEASFNKIVSLAAA